MADCFPVGPPALRIGGPGGGTEAAFSLTQARDTRGLGGSPAEGRSAAQAPGLGPSPGGYFLKEMADNNWRSPRMPFSEALVVFRKSLHCVMPALNSQVACRDLFRKTGSLGGLGRGPGEDGMPPCTCRLRPGGFILENGGDGFNGKPVREAGAGPRPRSAWLRGGRPSFRDLSEA